MKRRWEQRRGSWRKVLHDDHDQREGRKRRRFRLECHRGRSNGDGGRGEEWRPRPLPLSSILPSLSLLFSSTAALDSRNFFILL